MEHKPIQAIYRIIEAFEYLTDDIDSPLDKKWLKVAIVSHIAGDSPYPKEYIEKVIDIIYLSNDL